MQPDGHDRAIEPFEIHVDDAVLDDLRDRLGPHPVPRRDRRHGLGLRHPDRATSRELVDYWRDDVRLARRRRRALNAFAHFRTEIDGQSIHFVHARSPHADALPLLLTHGWPGSIVEFLDVIPRLTDPEAHGGDAADAFHVVAPSLPGYGFSEPDARARAGTSRASRARSSS